MDKDVNEKPSSSPRRWAWAKRPVLAQYDLNVNNMRQKTVHASQPILAHDKTKKNLYTRGQQQSTTTPGASINKSFNSTHATTTVVGQSEASVDDDDFDFLFNDLIDETLPNYAGLSEAAIGNRYDAPVTSNEDAQKDVVPLNNAGSSDTAVEGDDRGPIIYSNGKITDYGARHLNVVSSDDKLDQVINEHGNFAISRSQSDGDEQENAPATYTNTALHMWNQETRNETNESGMVKDCPKRPSLEPQNPCMISTMIELVDREFLPKEWWTSGFDKTWSDDLLESVTGPTEIDRAPEHVTQPEEQNFGQDQPVAGVEASPPSTGSGPTSHTADGIDFQVQKSRDSTQLENDFDPLCEAGISVDPAEFSSHVPQSGTTHMNQQQLVSGGVMNTQVMGCGNSPTPLASSPPLALVQSRVTRPQNVNATTVNVAGNSSRPYDFVKNAPDRDFKFHAINCTAVELLVFLPKAHLNYAVAERLMNNGMTYHLHQFITTRHRNHPSRLATTAEMTLEEAQECYNTNTILKGYQGAMRGGPARGQSSHPKWTFSSHQKPDLDDPSNSWDPLNINLGGYQPSRDTHPPAKRQRAPNSIPMEDLMKDVKRLPEGDDRAELTAAVLYAVDHPDQYRYPDDLLEVAAKAGLVEVTAEHSDAACIRRWQKNLDDFKKHQREIKSEIKKRKKADADEGPQYSMKRQIVNDTRYQTAVVPPLNQQFNPALQNQQFQLNPQLPADPNQQFPPIMPQSQNPTTGVSQAGLIYQPPVQLLRNCVLPTGDGQDDRDERFCIQFARSPEQVNVNWVYCQEHIIHILRLFQNPLYRDYHHPAPFGVSDLARCIRYAKHPENTNEDLRRTKRTQASISAILEGEEL
ncbi:hypothetical protein K432DRAFT_395454 [Lepidopterella palustris CBS 459.81]|uniref:Uncharacterized protein n=1 Tax=Lepidopterella palustris CBS 459.81 TaxID=1314670 RepID=A0A8E2JD40_9PEZI|nr:hypothetical protein K432DRAFT_395454 [Lepidopterella palustris CBS 459.81]